MFAVIKLSQRYRWAGERKAVKRGGKGRKERKEWNGWKKKRILAPLHKILVPPLFLTNLS